MSESIEVKPEGAEPETKAAQLTEAPDDVQRLVLAVRIGLCYIHTLNVEQFLELQDLSDQELAAKLGRLEITESARAKTFERIMRAESSE